MSVEFWVIVGLMVLAVALLTRSSRRSIARPVRTKR